MAERIEKRYQCEKCGLRITVLIVNKGKDGEEGLKDIVCECGNRMMKYTIKQKN